MREHLTALQPSTHWLPASPVFLCWAGSPLHTGCRQRSTFVLGLQPSHTCSRQPQTLFRVYNQVQ